MFMPSFLLLNAILTSVFAAVFVGREFVGRTFGMGILSGHSRRCVFIKNRCIFYGLVSFSIASGDSVSIRCDH